MCRKIMQIIRACKLSEPILHYVSMNGSELCPEQVCKLSGACELVRVKLSGLYCIALATAFAHKSQCFQCKYIYFYNASGSFDLQMCVSNIDYFASKTVFLNSVYLSIVTVYKVYRSIWIQMHIANAMAFCSQNQMLSKVFK